VGRDHRGRKHFSSDLSYEQLEQRMAAGYLVKKTPITPDFSFESFKALYAGEAIPLFVKTELSQILLATVDAPLKPRPGQTLFSLAPPKAQPLQAATPAAAPAVVPIPA
jgi:hypothetical protein